MSIKTYRAKSLHEALNLIRADLGPEAAVLHTRELRTGLIGRMMRGRMIEVAASTTVHVPSRFAAPTLPEAQPPVRELAFAESPGADPTFQPRPADGRPTIAPPETARPLTDGPTSDGAPADQAVEAVDQPPLLETDYRTRYREAVRLQASAELDELGATVKQVDSESSIDHDGELPDACFRAFTDLIEAGIDEATCRSLMEHAREGAPSFDANDYRRLRVRLEQCVAQMLPTTGGIRLLTGKRRVVALVGPTGVGKTTTIAKLAANFRLRERRRVGLVTVDTYRVAAVEQLRTYADIIDLPMEVVSTPREMREAINRLADLDLVLVDTAGRSPRDEVKIQELKSMLGEASADEVALVLSSTAGENNLSNTLERFACSGVTSLIYTKLDEATSLGHLLPVTQTHALPISYLTDGQNVPDDIQAAEARGLARRILEVAA